jgi:CRP/FNR family transcriptional regulator, cyclic AMP receptor protein
MDTRTSAGAVDLSTLMRATRRNKGRDSLEPHFGQATWDAMADYLERVAIDARRVLIEQGSKDRNLYFVESGLLRVFRSDKTSRLQLAVLGAGAVIGEGTFFAPIVRNASVEAMEPTVLWELTPERFALLADGHPKAAFEIAMGLGCVLSVRMLSVAGRLAIT